MKCNTTTNRAVPPTHSRHLSAGRAAPEETTPLWLRIWQVTRRYGISKSHFYTLVEQGVMPKAFKPSSRVALWEQTELDVRFRQLADEQRAS